MPRSARVLVVLSTLLAACGGGASLDDGGSYDAGPEDAGRRRDAGRPMVRRDGGPDGGPPTEPWFDRPTEPAPPSIPWLDDGAPPVAAPEIPWLAEGAPAVTPPSMTCPAGWHTIPVAGQSACDPYPSGGPSVCPVGQAHFPGGAGCAPIGGACPTGGALYSPELPTDGTPILYVRAGATGGTGSLASPFGSIGAAIAAAGATRTVIALSTGTFAEAITLRDGIVIQGACAGLTTIAPPGTTVFAGTVTLTAGSAELRDVTVGGNRPGLIVGGATARLAVYGVHVHRTALAAVNVSSSAQFTGEGLVVSETQPNLVALPPTLPLGILGHALDVSGGAQVSIRRVLLDRNRAYGIVAATSSVRLEDASIRDTRVQAADGTLGVGILAGDSTVTLVRADVSGSTINGIATSGATSVLTLTDVLVGGTRRAAGLTAAGVSAYGGALHADRLLVRDNDDFGLELQEGGTGSARDLIVSANAGIGMRIPSGCTLELARAIVHASQIQGIGVDGGSLDATDLVVASTSSGADGSGGGGIVLTAGATVTLANAIVRDHYEVGVSLNGAGTTLRATDLAILDARAGSVGVDGAGLVVLAGASATIDRALVARNRVYGALAAGEGAVIDARDLVVRDVASAADGGRGHGVEANNGATVTIARGVVGASHELGVAVVDAGATMTDVVVEDTAAASDGGLGEGVGVQGGGTLRLERAIVRRNRRSGIYAIGEGTVLELTDALVADTESELSTGLSGLGVIVQLGASGTLRRVLLSRCRDVGLALNHAGTVVDAEDVVARDGLPATGTGTGGRGFSFQGGASLTLRRALVERAGVAGVSARDDGAIVLEDITVRDIGPGGIPGAGHGVALTGVRGEVRRVRIERATSTGLAATGGANLIVTDLIAVDTEADPTSGTGGRGVNVQNAAVVTLTRAIVEGSHEIAVFADREGTALTLEHAVVRSSQSRPLDRRYGAGLWAQLGARVVVRDAIFDTNRYAGVISVGNAERGGPDVTLEHVVVYQTLESECVDEGGGCPEVSGGIGIGSYWLGAVRATDFTLVANVLCGVQVSGDATLDLSDGLVSDSAIGACVQVEAYDLDRLSARVVYRNNGVNLQATTLPVPDAAASLADLPATEPR